MLFITDCAIKNSIQTEESFSIAMFDMDNFKSINEFLGYKTGDIFIKEIAKEVSIAASKSFLNAYRFGGEEFVIVMDSRSPEEQEAIAQRVIEKIQTNEFIKSNSDLYIQNAKAKLQQYEDMNHKIAQLIPLEAKRATLEDLRNNFVTKEARNDDYLLHSIRTTDIEIKRLYLELINERIVKEDNQNTKARLKNIKLKFEQGIELEEKEKQALDEYLLSIYSKNYEIYQTKKWISDFERNNGFSITGGIATFRPESLRDKSAIDVINYAGEVVKEGKNKKKGKSYFKYIEQ